MAEEKNIREDHKTKKHEKKHRRNLMYNKWIVKNIPFYFFISAIAIIYIANGHYADKTMREINATEKNLKEMEYEFKTVKQEVIFRSKESELAKAVEPLGLKPLVVPPLRIVDTLEEK
ncbi:MAG TPA: FtsL-like putative cell division protein [Hanamia sp.]|jgi:predicted membrane protein|nr:FtsL-like putative cell division protein [Hanamia sp.]